MVADHHLTHDLRDDVRALVFAAFGERFSDDDWRHAAGGWRAILLDGATPVAHAAVVERDLDVGSRSVRAGYVEAVATRPGSAGRGAGSVVMTSLAEVIRAQFEMGALSTSRRSFYARLGWESWRGPSSVRHGASVVRTPEEDAGLMVLRFGVSNDVDLTWPITCDTRTGDDW